MTPSQVVAGIRSVRQGHSPNCSASGTVVGAMLLTSVATALVVNAYADRLFRFLEGDDNVPPPRVRSDEEGATVHVSSPPGRLRVSSKLALALLAAGASSVGRAAERRPPDEVHVSLTSRCPVACTGCYLSAGPERVDPPDLQARVRSTLAELAEMGVLEVAFGGGEALSADGVLPAARYARSLGLVPNLTTSGFALSETNAQQLAEVMGQVNISLDGLGEAYRAVRGFQGDRVALRAIERLREAGVRVGVNTVITRANLHQLPELGRELAARGVSEWQWLRLKPSGRGQDAWQQLAPTPEALDGLWQLALDVEAETGLTLRFDCALVPFLVHQGLDLERLAAHQVAGCPGGESLWARHADGGWSPCSFVDGSAESGTLTETWERDATLERWRGRAAAPPEPCASCEAAAICRGGCRVVSAHLTGDPLAPDPECPRVRALASAL